MRCGTVTRDVGAEQRLAVSISALVRFRIALFTGAVTRSYTGTTSTRSSRTEYMYNIQGRPIYNLLLPPSMSSAPAPEIHSLPVSLTFVWKMTMFPSFHISVIKV